MFEFEPDEYIFTKFAFFFKKRRIAKQAELQHAINLNDIKPRLSIFARAITGESIEIFEAEREGGYRNNNFFLPSKFYDFQSEEENLSFYLFRVLYLSIQKSLDLNWNDNQEHETLESQQKAEDTSTIVLKSLFKQFPITEKYHQQFLSFYENKSTKKNPADYSFIYGKWMRNDIKDNLVEPLENFTDQVKKANKEQPKTIIKSKAVEEIISVQIDQQQMQDAVLQHQFEKVETAEEFGGNFKDMDGDDDLDDHSNALDEVNIKHTVRVDDTAHSVYHTDFIENTTIAESSESESNSHFITYDEWNYVDRNYKEGFCKVYPKTQLASDGSYYKKTLNDNRSTLVGLRKMLTTVNNKYQQQRRQSQGEELDVDAITDLFVDVKSGHTPSEKIYLSKRKKEKDLSILLLLDISLSSDGYAAGNRVIDVEKQVSILFGEILNEFNIDFSINCFYSKTRNHSSYLTIKGFDENWDTAKYKVGGVEPNGYTRIGTALRHSGALLDKRDTKNKWVILLSDGKPNDYDKYEGKYGINDVKQALRELNERQINSYALAIEAQAKYYLPQMFGQNHYQILTNPVELLQSLVKLYEKIKHQS
ncbi:nitric oxide reductase activation protein NorD [Ichthyenterobacterium magnum]|uniref:Nitric oxide reductase NorD protein n=1 Tax=Ichthyenterobacterium magnum TaxID=1230530 RepID=A0A420DVC7_9FLAO|nr:VWA domain-containing protein [Ichthyenterobacterium magnum]RKE98158.1 nitric oxide reductase NorD protein [Ichthyenterobacterium magnum]